MAASKRLSEAIPTEPQGDRLVAVDHQIEHLDLVKWDTTHIKYINFQFNLIEYLNGLSQFKNLVGLDLSNNNVCALSDLRLLSRNEHLEVVDLTNNPITHHEFYREFLMIFVKNLKTLDRVPVNPKWVERAQKDSSHIKDALLKLLVNFLKILSAKSIHTRLAINEELKSRLGSTEPEVSIRRSKVFEILQSNIMESFDDQVLVEFEAHILNDIEKLMNHLPTSMSFYEVWGKAVAELGSRQLENLQRHLSLLDLDERSIKRLVIDNEEEVEKPAYSAPRPQVVESFASPGGQKYSHHSRSRIGEGSGGKYNIELTATFQDRSPHLRNCLGLGLDDHHHHHSSSKSPQPKKKTRLNILEKANTAQKRAVELEEILKEKLGHLVVLEKESIELDRQLSSHQSQLQVLEAVPLEPLEDEVLGLKKQVDCNQQLTVGLASLRRKEQTLQQEKAKLLARIEYLKKRLQELKNKPDTTNIAVRHESDGEEHPRKRSLRGSDSEEESERDQAKLNMFVSIREDRGRTKLFSTWKDTVRNNEEDRLETTITTKQLKADRLRAQEAAAQAEEAYRRDLDDLKRRLEQPAAPRVIPETKIFRKQLIAVAEHYHVKTLSNLLQTAFKGWRDTNTEYRREAAKTRALERLKSLRLIFTALKEVKSKLQNAKQIAAQKIQFINRGIATKAIQALKQVVSQQRNTFSLLQAKSELHLIGPLFSAWRASTHESQEQKFFLALVRKKSQKIRLEAAFRNFKEGVHVWASQREGLQKALEARRRVHLRRKLQQFQRNGIVAQGTSKVIREGKLRVVQPIFDALRSHAAAGKAIRQGLVQLSALEAKRKADANHVLLFELKSQFYSQMNLEKAVLDFQARRRLRSNRTTFGIFISKWVIAKRASYLQNKKKQEEFEGLIGSKKPVHASCEEDNFQLYTDRKRLDESLALAEEKHEETSSILTEIAKLEDLLLEFDQKESDWQIEAESNLAKIQSQLQIDVEGVADLSSNIDIALEDHKMLEDCFKAKEHRLFEERERTKQLQRELDCEAVLHSTLQQDLEKQKKQSQTILGELKTKNTKLNKILNDAEVELSGLKVSVKTLESDYHADLMYKEELEKKVILRSQKVELGRQIVKNEEAKEQNYRLETEYHIGRSGALDRTLNGHFQIRKWSRNRTQDQDDEKESPDATLALLRSAKPESWGDKSTRDLINTSGPGAWAEEPEPLEHNPEDPVLLGLHADLRQLRLRREGMVCDLQTKIKALEAELLTDSN